MRLRLRVAPVVRGGRGARIEVRRWRRERPQEARPTASKLLCRLRRDPERHVLRRPQQLGLHVGRRRVRVAPRGSSQGLLVRRHHGHSLRRATASRERSCGRAGRAGPRIARETQVPDSISGLCAAKCPDGSPRHHDVCANASDCLRGQVNLTGECLLAAPTGSGLDPESRVTWACGPGGCTYSMPRGTLKCSENQCAVSCPHRTSGLPLRPTGSVVD